MKFIRYARLGILIDAQHCHAILINNAEDIIDNWQFSFADDVQFHKQFVQLFRKIRPVTHCIFSIMPSCIRRQTIELAANLRRTELFTYIKQQSSSWFQLPADTLAFDFYCTSINQYKTQLTIFAMPKSAANKLVQLCKYAKLPYPILTPLDYVLYRWVMNLSPKTERPWLVLCLGEEFGLLLVADESIKFSQKFAYYNNDNDITACITRTLALYACQPHSKIIDQGYLINLTNQCRYAIAASLPLKHTTALSIKPKKILKKLNHWSDKHWLTYLFTKQATL